MSIESYGLFTNKGGVGKTTLTFHLASLYAELNPDKRIVLVDMCPQANLSNTVLTSAEGESGWTGLGGITVPALRFVWPRKCQLVLLQACTQCFRTHGAGCLC